jgi:DNA-binding LacI/PurR family transcriptional regulator
MTDVARVARVSHQTVSRVLNGHPNVRPETRVRVLDAIEQLGYRPNLAARALATGRSNALGLVTLDSMLLGPVATMYAVEQAARRAGYSVSIRSQSSIDRASLADSLSHLVQQSVAGAIVIAPIATTDSALEVLSAEIPIVVVEAAPQGEVSAVIVDQQKGAYTATKHLLDLGHRTVAHISGPSDWIEARERVVGWRRALEEAGVEPPAVIMGDWSAQSGYDAGRLIADASEITAVFAANDNMALGLLRALNERGRLIPRDLSVVGFDDVAEAAFFSPPLTTIRQDFAAMGSRAVELLLRQLAAPGRKVERIELTPELVLRESTAEA